MKVIIITLATTFTLLKLTGVIDVDWIYILFPASIYLTMLATNRFTLWAVERKLEELVDKVKEIKQTGKESTFQKRLREMQENKIKR